MNPPPKTLPAFTSSLFALTIVLAILLVGPCLTASAASCSVLDRVQRAQPRLLSDDLFAIEYLNGNFVAVGSHGATLSSPDGMAWTNPLPVVRRDLRSVTASGDTYVAVGDHGVGISSPDAQAWEGFSVGVQTNLSGVAFGAGQFVAVGAGGIIVSSDDAKTWVPRTSGVSNDLYGIVYGSGVFVTFTSTNEVLVSSDGLAWSRQRLAATLVRGRAVRGGFVAVSADQQLAASLDGRIWSLVTTHNLGLVNDFAADGKELVAVGPAGLIARRTNSVDWARIAPPATVATRDLFGIAVGPSLTVVVGERGTLIGIPAGGGPATDLNRDRFDDLRGVAWGNGWYVAVGSGGTVFAATSPTNKWLTPATGTTNDLAAVAFGMGRFVAVGGAFTNAEAGPPHATILTSVNGTNWTTVFAASALTNRETGELTWPAGIAFGNDRFVVVASGGAAMVSANTTEWETRFDPALAGCTSVGFADGQFVAVGTQVATSTDGLQWALQTAPTLGGLAGVAGGAGRWVAVGVEPGAITPVAALQWTNLVALQTESLGGVTFGATQFVAVGTNGQAFSSFDGVTWSEHFLNTASFLRSVTFGGAEYVAVGDRGTIVYTAPADPDTGLPSPSHWIHTGGGVERDSAGAVAVSAECGFFLTGGLRGDAMFDQTSVTGGTEASFFLGRYADTGKLDWLLGNSAESLGTALTLDSDGGVMVGGSAPAGITFDGAEALAGDGLGGFVASFGADGSGVWQRQFAGALADLISIPAEIRFAGTFQGLLAFGDEMVLESTNVPTSFFLVKADNSGTNAWGRIIAPTMGPLHGLKLVADRRSLELLAVGSAAGTLSFLEPVPVPPDGGGDPGGDPPCPPDHDPLNSALDPCNPNPGAGGALFTNKLTGTLVISNGPALFITKYDGSGKWLWATNTGLVGALPVGAGTDGTNGVIVGGNSAAGLFVARFDSEGRQLWLRQYEPGGAAQLTAFACSPEGHAFAAGYFQGTADFGEGLQVSSGGTGGFVLHFDSFGQLLSTSAEGTAEPLVGFSAPTALAAPDPREFVLGGYFDERVILGGEEFVTQGLSDVYVARLRTPAAAGVFLRYQPDPGGLRLEWPPGAVLQQSSTLSPSAWSDLSTEPPLVVPVDAPARFFRVRAH